MLSMRAKQALNPPPLIKAKPKKKVPPRGFFFDFFRMSCRTCKKSEATRFSVFTLHIQFCFAYSP